MKVSKVSRRRFLVAGIGSVVASGGGVFWIRQSDGRVARWLRQMAAEATRPTAPPPVTPEPGRWDNDHVTVCWIGHATTLINFFGVWILTDPVFTSRVGVDVGIGTAGPKRYVAPALDLDELPPIDLVLLSHAHMDHIDLPTLRSLSGAPATVTAPLTQDLLDSTPLRAADELRWGERARYECAAGSIEVEAFEVKHWGRRWPSKLNRGYNGYLLRREGKAVLFGGDTAQTSLFTDLRRKGPFTFGLMPIAAYDPWIRNHCTPEEAVEMANQAGVERIVPIHHQTFRLSEEPMDEPLQRLEEALRREPERLALRQVGESAHSPS